LQYIGGRVLHRVLKRPLFRGLSGGRYPWRGGGAISKDGHRPQHRYTSPHRKNRSLTARRECVQLRRQLSILFFDYLTGRFLFIGSPPFDLGLPALDPQGRLRLRLTPRYYPSRIPRRPRRLCGLLRSLLRHLRRFLVPPSLPRPLFAPGPSSQLLSRSRS